MQTGLDIYGDLPIFPTLYAPLSDYNVELIVERLMDKADAQFMAGKATQAQYDAWVRALDKWADGQKIARKW